MKSEILYFLAGSLFSVVLLFCGMVIGYIVGHKTLEKTLERVRQVFVSHGQERKESSAGVVEVVDPDEIESDSDKAELKKQQELLRSLR